MINRHHLAITDKHTLKEMFDRIMSEIQSKLVWAKGLKNISKSERDEYDIWATNLAVGLQAELITMYGLRTSLKLGDADQRDMSEYIGRYRPERLLSLDETIEECRRCIIDVNDWIGTITKILPMTLEETMSNVNRRNRRRHVTGHRVIYVDSLTTPELTMMLTEDIRAKCSIMIGAELCNNDLSEANYSTKMMKPGEYSEIDVLCKVVGFLYAAQEVGVGHFEMIVSGDKPGFEFTTTIKHHYENGVRMYRIERKRKSFVMRWRAMKALTALSNYLTNVPDAYEQLEARDDIAALILETYYSSRLLKGFYTCWENELPAVQKFLSRNIKHFAKVRYHLKTNVVNDYVYLMCKSTNLLETTIPLVVEVEGE